MRAPSGADPAEEVEASGMRPSLLKSQPSPDLTFSWQCALHSSTARNLKTSDPLRGAPSECALQAITWTTVQPVVFERSYGKDARHWALSDHRGDGQSGILQDTSTLCPDLGVGHC